MFFSLQNNGKGEVWVSNVLQGLPTERGVIRKCANSTRQTHGNSTVFTQFNNFLGRLIELGDVRAEI